MPFDLSSRGWSAFLAVLLAVLTGACQPEPATPDSPRITVGIAATVEQRVLAALTREVLEDLGYAVATAETTGDTVSVRSAALDGEVDVFWDYSGAAWTLGMGRAQPSTDPRESFEAVQAADRENGLLWVAPSDVNATLAMFVRAVERPPAGAGTLSWLAGQLAVVDGGLCADAEFLDRPTGYQALAEAYAISIDLVATRPTSESKGVTSVAAGECYAALATATSGTAVNAGLAPVIDDQQVFPAFVVAPVVTEDTPPDVVQALEDLAGTLDAGTLARLNAAVTAGEDPASVAQAHLQDA